MLNAVQEHTDSPQISLDFQFNQHLSQYSAAWRYVRTPTIRIATSVTRF